MEEEYKPNTESVTPVTEAPEYTETPGHTESPEHSDRELGDIVKEKLAGWLEPILNKPTGDNSKISWGFVVFGVIALYAAYKLVRSLSFFF